MATPANPPAPPNLFEERLLSRRGTLAPAAHRVATFIDQNRATALASSALEIAAATQTSDATVVRAIQALGFEGLVDLKHALVEAMDHPSTPLDDMRRTLAEVGESASRATALVLDAHAEALAVLRSPEAQARLAAAIATLHPARRIVTFGMGPSGALANYVSVLLGRGGRSSATLDRTGLMLADQLLALRPGDAVLVLAYGRPYREVTALFGEARHLGLPLVLVTDNPETRLARVADAVLLVPRGRAERVALHGATLVLLEALLLSLSALDGPRAIAALDRLNELRRRL